MLSVLNHESKPMKHSVYPEWSATATSFSTQPRVETDETVYVRGLSSLTVSAFSTQPRVETDETNVPCRQDELELYLSVLNHESKPMKPAPHSGCSGDANALSVLNHESKPMKQ